MIDKAVVILSGGMDSYTLLKELQHDAKFELHAISVNYGQKHAVELEFAKTVCKEEGIPHRIIDLSSLKSLLAASALTSDQDVPHGHYEDENMKQTVVPNRNAILITIAAGYAITIGASYVFTGVHAGDHAIYPDCRPEFITKMDAVLQIANYERVNLEAPFLYMTKGQIAAIGAELGLDYGKAWTCYDPQTIGTDGRIVACGKCGACQERLEAMRESGATDTMEYIA